MTAQPQTTTHAPATRAESFGLFALAIALFAIAWPVMKIGLAGATPVWFAAGRAILGAAASFLLLAGMRQLRLPSRRDMPLQALPWQMLLAAILLTIFAALFEPGGHIAPRGGVLLPLVYLGVFAGPAASWASTSVARALPTVVTSLGFLGVPAIGLVISTLWLGETVTLALIAGGVLIALGLVLVITARQR
jgi:drug/metabolite transporter (DMT)-like permease